MTDVLQQHHELERRITREELRQIEAPSGYLPFRGIRLSFLQVGVASDPGVYVVAWDTLLTSTADASCDLLHAPASIELLTPGLWSFHVVADVPLKTDTGVDVDGDKLRVVPTLLLDGAEIGSSVGHGDPPYAAGSYATMIAYLSCPPVLVTTPGTLTLELLPGFGDLAATGKKMTDASATLEAHLITEVG